MKYLLIVCLSLMSLVTAAQQWVRINSLPFDFFNAMAKDNNMLYAATFGNTLYISPDNGTNWRAVMPGPDSVVIEAIAVFNHNIYLGTDDTGIWMTTDTGRTWVNSAANLLPVSSFSEWRNNLYASTFGEGIFKLNTANNTWSSFNNQLPNYSVNIFKLINENDTLIATSAANGAYYRFNPATGAWDERFYLSVLSPTLQVRNIVYSSGKMLGVNSGTLLFHTDNGSDWHLDTLGVRKGMGFQATINVGASNFYVVVNEGSGRTSWVQKKAITAPVTDSWVDEGEPLPQGFTFAIEEFNSKLYLLRTDGIYVKDVITAVGDTPDTDDENISIYPNPSGGSTVNVRSDKLVNEITIVNLSGITIFHSLVQKKQFTLPFLKNGLYIVQLRVNKKLTSYKILIE